MDIRTSSILSVTRIFVQEAVGRTAVHGLLSELRTHLTIGIVSGALRRAVVTAEAFLSTDPGEEEKRLCEKDATVVIDALTVIEHLGRREASTLPELPINLPLILNQIGRYRLAMIETRMIERVEAEYGATVFDIKDPVPVAA